MSCFRGDRLVLDGVSFAVPAGGAVVLLGPNGVGKSTLLRVLAGLKRIDAGRVIFDGSADFSTRVAYLGHQDAVKPGLSVLENLAFSARIGGGDARAALEAAGLGSLAALPARMLSGGQRRRLALARFFVLGAALWLLDEPTVGLDAAAVARFAAALATHRASGGVIVASTHVELPLVGSVPIELGSGDLSPAGSRGSAPGLP
ncbi:MAG: heme ABC exporter ATP-binding protein CcmA [Rhodospirillales bacterium]